MWYESLGYGILISFVIKLQSFRGRLEQNLKLLGFNSILHFKASCSFDDEEEGEARQGVQVGAEFHRTKPKSLKDRFKDKVGEHCKEGAFVFIYVSGVQFPFQVSLTTIFPIEASRVSVLVSSLKIVNK